MLREARDRDIGRAAEPENQVVERSGTGHATAIVLVVRGSLSRIAELPGSVDTGGTMSTGLAMRARH
jgi:hypothetical protein